MMRSTALLLSLCLLPLAAQAETYRMDLIVFLDKSGSGEPGRAAVAPDTSRAIELDNPAALKSAGISILPEEQFGLADEWQHLRLSKNYQPLIKLAWLQKDPPGDRSLPLHIRWGDALPANNGSVTLRPVDGTVAMVLQHYLHLDTDLVYTQKSGDGAVSWRLREKRKMKRDELHHLDSPKLGVLTRVSKAAP